MLTFIFMFTVYILYSAKADRYYIGYTSGSVETRLRKHLAVHKGFTGKQDDWQIVYTETFESKQGAMAKEKEMKKWKSKKMIEKLIGSAR